MEKKAKVPKLRFPGFTDEWEQHNAGKIFISITDKNHPELPVLSASQELGMIKRDDSGINIQHEVKSESTYKHVMPGQFVIHLRSFQGGFAHSNVEGITSPAYTVMDFNNKEQHNDLFWKYIFMRQEFIDSLVKVTYGIRDGRSISYKDFCTLLVCYPNYAEQQQIGSFFQCFDRLITLHQHELTYLQAKKKSLLQKMFPKKGERFPELRFPGFTDEWEQHNAGKIFISITDKNHPELPVLSASQELGMIKRDDSGINIQHEVKSESTYKHVMPGQFVIHLRSFQGGFAHSNVEGITSPAYTVMDFNKKEQHNDLFWKYIFMRQEFIDSLVKVTYGIRDGRSISYKDFCTLLVYYPNCAEQQQIGSFFQRFDKFITLHQRKLAHLQKQKKALLQQMFV